MSEFVVIGSGAGSGASSAPSRPVGRVSMGERVRETARNIIGPELYRAARDVYRLARGKELRAPFPLSQKLAAWRRGFRADAAAVYDFGHNDPRNYVNDSARLYICPRINPARAFYDQKLMLRAFLLGHGLAQPETVALTSNGIVQLFPLAPDSRTLSPAEFECWLREDGGEFVVKPQDGRRGSNIFLLSVDDGAIRRRRGRDERPFRADVDFRGVMLVERRVEQGDFWRALSPASTNTIRAVTMWTPGDREPFLGAAVQRIGTADTAPTDNWSGGGISARIDLETGRLGVGRVKPRAGERSQGGYARHPDSGAQIEGAVVPHWDRVRDAVLRAAGSLVVNRYVGWDVVVDDAGTPVFIEGNGNTDVDLLQVHGGLLADPKVRRFYETCGAA